MIGTYFKIAVRKLYHHGRDRSSIYSWINILGLTIGLSAFLLIARVVHYELSYDRFYPRHDRISRLTVERLESGEITLQSAKTYAGIGEILVNEVPEVRDYVRILSEECMFTYEPEEIIINRQPTFWADGNIIDFFGLKMLSRGQLDLLYTPNQAIISKSAAKRFFGIDWKYGTDPIGKTLLLNGGVPFMIQGVFDDLPENLHMKVDFIVSYSTLMALLGDFMNTTMPPQSNFVYTYLLSANGVDVKQLEPIVNEVIARHTGELHDQVKYRFYLQPVTSIHLYSHFSDELISNGNHLFVLALSLAAFLIIIVAWINFINLTVARAINRTREVGIRKTLGAGKSQLVIQFILETFFSGSVALILAMAVVTVTEVFFNRITGIATHLFRIESWPVWIIFLGTFLAGTFLASIYPAMILSSIHPIRVLRGHHYTIRGNRYLQQGLVLFQFFVAMLLVAGTGAVYYQVESMRKQPLGVVMDQVLVLHSPRSMIGNPDRALYFRQFRDILEPEPQIERIASGGCLPGEPFLYHAGDIHAEGFNTEINWSFDIASVDERYLLILDMQLLAGRNFEDQPGEENRVILNETGTRALGFHDPGEAVGQFIRINQGTPQEVIGVVKDVHFEGLHTTIKPLLLKYGHDYEFGFFLAKVNTENLPRTLEKIENQWRMTYPKDPLEFFFLDQFFDRQYTNEQSFGQIFGTFSLLAIFISAIGLFGLISFTTYQKSKEIGIRKVMGATVVSIINLLTGNILKLILLAGLISMPLAYWIIGQWLDTFAYRFEPALWMYLIPLCLILVTSLLAVISQTLNSALSNPVDAIANE